MYRTSLLLCCTTNAPTPAPLSTSVSSILNVMIVGTRSGCFEMSALYAIWLNPSSNILVSSPAGPASIACVLGETGCAILYVIVFFQVGRLVTELRR